MTGETASDVHRQAAELSGESGEVEGPLKGYHHEAYAFTLPAENPLSAKFVRGKVRAPRPGLLWYDRRCFVSEDRLLMELQGRIERIPGCVNVGDFYLQGFVEGRTLGSGPLRSRTLSPLHTRQLGRLFRELVAIKTDELEKLERHCEPEDRPPDGDTTGFLLRLIVFTERLICERHVAEYGSIFEELGVLKQELDRLRDRSKKLTKRPFTLIHGDLHRQNFIVDTDGDLWTIDWELAMIGDPLYELATHLHLMRYPHREELRIAKLWQTEVESVLPGSSLNWEQDLPILLAYKRTQSVFTDIIRTALALGPGPEPNWRVLPRAAWKLQRALAAAQEPLSLTSVPTLRQVVSAYTSWFRLSADRSAPPRG